jgi:hypothetical protein
VQVKVLNKEECSAKVEDQLREPVRLLARPLTSEPARESEPIRILNIELCSVTLEVDPKEPVRPLARPLTSELTRPNEPPRDLSDEP